LQAETSTNPNGDRTPEALLSKAAAGESLNGVEVGIIFKNGKSTVSENATKGPEHFRKWSQKRDPAGVAWRVEGEGNDRRYYRG
jgi:hypothetical protein